MYLTDHCHVRVDDQGPQRRSMYTGNKSGGSQLVLITDVLEMATLADTWANTYPRRGLSKQ